MERATSLVSDRARARHALDVGAQMLGFFTREQLKAYADSVYDGAMLPKPRRGDRLLMGRWLLAGAIKGLPAALEALRRTGDELAEAKDTDESAMIDKALTFLAQSVGKGACQLDAVIEALRQMVDAQ